MAGPLRRALEALERREDEEALQRLLEAWRAARAERLALLVERFSKLDGGPVPVGGLLDLLRLRESLVEKTGRALSSSSVGMELSDFLQLPADPRFTPALLDLAVLPVVRAEVAFLPLCELFIKQKDPRTHEPLSELCSRLPAESAYARRLDVVLGRITERAPPRLSGEASALCDALEEALTLREEALARSAPLREELLARVCANPEDDDARRVLADHLMAQGDPLGEFITLQCQPQPDAPRIALLLEQHRAKWEALLGLGVWREEVRFERGLPVAVKMRVPHGQLLPPPGLFWCTVREIDWSWSGGGVQADWLAHPHLRGVTVLREVPPGLAARLGTHPLPVRELETVCAEPRRVAEQLASLASLPHLASMRLRWAGPDGLRRYAGSPLARRLERFETGEEQLWWLEVWPGAEVPLKAELYQEDRCQMLAEALRAAMGFSIGALRIQSRHPLGAGNRRLLEEAASGYARVEWRLPPG